MGHPGAKFRFAFPSFLATAAAAAGPPTKTDFK